jgi:hypothetical protein
MVNNTIEKQIDVVPGKVDIKRVSDGSVFETKVKAEYIAKLTDCELVLTFIGTEEQHIKFEENLNIQTPKHFFKIQLFPSTQTTLEDY